MSVAVDSSVIDGLLLGQGDRRRQLQDFPVLVDVWTELALRPEAMHDLLITPHRDIPAARVADWLEEHIQNTGHNVDERVISYLQGLVATRASLEDIWSVIIPGSNWFYKIRMALAADKRTARLQPKQLEKLLELQLKVEVARAPPVTAAEAERSRDEGAVLALRKMEARLESRPSHERQLIRLGLLLGVLRAAQEKEGPPITRFAELEGLSEKRIAQAGTEAIGQALNNYDYLDDLEDRTEGRDVHTKLIWSVSANRPAEFAVMQSVPAIKADAARQLFNIKCKELSWAILDSGIAANHPAFKDHDSPAGGHRIKATFDFGAIRQILNKANRLNPRIRARLAAKLAAEGSGTAADIDDKLLKLAEGMQRELPIDWSLVDPLIRRDSNQTTSLHPHGTHVAGILGGNWLERDDVRMRGVCPDIRLYDFRVLGPDKEQTEFAVIAALQFIRYLNDRNAFSVIDGVNMSLSIPHNVRNYACGQTPVCLEAEALAASGVVIVAAAGNHGYQRYRLADDSSFESYAASSITDPGNADAVITVGATHRYWPHTYGVSFFSSRGPTGDGRLKPDVLAPGERIDSCIPGEAMDTMDGTSMAAPHVSGAAALLMARHRELRGRPRKIKEILCATATDLGRERSFQGHGMVDVLRAIQSI